MDRDTEDYIRQLEKRLVLLEGRVAMLEARQMYPTTPLYRTTTHTGCGVCGIGSDGRVMGYVCNRNDCPTKVTC